MSDFIADADLPAPESRHIFPQLSKDSWLAIGLFVLLAFISGISIYQQTKDQAAPPLMSHSTQPDGAQGLWLWLEALNYEVSDHLETAFAIPKNTDVVLMLEPTTLVDPSEWPILEEWVETGGTLIIAGDGLFTDRVLAHFDFGISLRPPPVAEIVQQNPLLASPASHSLPLAANTLALQSERDDYVTHFAVGGAPVLVSLRQGSGRILLTTLATPFTNKGLQEEGHPEFVLNLISAAGEAQSVWFDEWHHGLRVQSSDIVGIGAWLQRTPLGRAFVFIAVVLFIALVLQGRSFGRPVPLPQDSSRRAPLEYITALANLSRRAGHRTAVMQDYVHRLKKNIGHRYRLNPTLPDEEFLAQLAEYNTDLDLVALRNLLRRLAKPNVGETEMVQLAAEVSEWL